MINFDPEYTPVYLMIDKMFKFKNIVAALPKDADQVAIHFSNWGWLLQCTINGNRVIAMLRFADSLCEAYYCEKPISFSINLDHFRVLLSQSHDEDDIILFWEPPHKMGLVFRKNPSGDTERKVLGGLAPYDGSLLSIDVEDYKIGVGIASDVFSEVLKYMRYGTGPRERYPIPTDVDVRVHIFISRSMVKFISGDREMELKPPRVENLNKLVISGAEDGVLYHVELTLSRVSSYIRAARSTDMVWLHADTGRPSLMRFPFAGDLGDLLFSTS